MNSLLINKISEMKKEYKNNKYLFIPQILVIDLIKQLGAEERY